MGLAYKDGRTTHKGVILGSIGEGMQAVGMNLQEQSVDVSAGSAVRLAGHSNPSQKVPVGSNHGDPMNLNGITGNSVKSTELRARYELVHQ